MSPTTSNFSPGLVVPIPTFPLEETINLVTSPLWALTLKSPGPPESSLSIIAFTLPLSFNRKTSPLTSIVASDTPPSPSISILPLKIKSPLALMFPLAVMCPSTFNPDEFKVAFVAPPTESNVCELLAAYVKFPSAKSLT